MRTVVPAGRTAAVAASNALGGSPCARARIPPNAARDKTTAPTQFVFVHFVILMFRPCFSRNLTVNWREYGWTTSKVDSPSVEAKTCKGEIFRTYEDSYDRDSHCRAAHYK